MDIKEFLIQKAIKKQKTIIFPEANFSDRIQNAGVIIAQKGIAKVVFVGDENLCQKFKNQPNILVVNPQNFEKIEDITNIIFEKRKNKGLSLQEAKDFSLDSIYFANAYVLLGLADGIVCGAEVSTAKTLKPALQLIKGKSGLVSSYFLFVGKNKVTDDVFIMGDCAVVENPNAEELATIAKLMLEECQKMNLLTPRFAFLSYSTNGSAKSEVAQKVKDAYKIFKQKNPNIYAMGEVQFDACTKANVAKTNMPDFDFVAPANVFVMPNIEAGNIGYKMVQYFGGLEAIGPITLGFNRPVNDLSRGCTVEDIIMVTAITCIQAN